MSLLKTESKEIVNNKITEVKKLRFDQPNKDNLDIYIGEELVFSASSFTVHLGQLAIGKKTKKKWKFYDHISKKDFSKSGIGFTKSELKQKVKAIAKAKNYV